METIQNEFIHANGYRDLPLSHLQESPTNPRRRYSAAGLEELAASIKAQGILAPLLVRKIEPERFEVIAGSRRFRAAQLAGVEEVPVRVIPMTDAEAVFAQVVENLQREDIHPLEEATASGHCWNCPASIAISPPSPRRQGRAKATSHNGCDSPS